MKIDIVIGKVYQRYKGGMYVITDIGYLESNGQEMIVYQAFPNSDASQTWIRPVDEFQEKFKPV